MPLKALAINCKLKVSLAESCCDRLISETLAELERCGGNGEKIRPAVKIRVYS